MNLYSKYPKIGFLLIAMAILAGASIYFYRICSRIRSHVEVLEKIRAPEHIQYAVQPSRDLPAKIFLTDESVYCKPPEHFYFMRNGNEGCWRRDSFTTFSFKESRTSRNFEFDLIRNKDYYIKDFDVIKPALKKSDDEKITDTFLFSLGDFIRVADDWPKLITYFGFYWSDKIHDPKYGIPD